MLLPLFQDRGHFEVDGCRRMVEVEDDQGSLGHEALHLFLPPFGIEKDCRKGVWRYEEIRAVRDLDERKMRVQRLREFLVEIPMRFYGLYEQLRSEAVCMLL